MPVADTATIPQQPSEAYASVKDVEGRTLQKFSSDEQQDRIVEFLKEGKQRIDGALRQFGAPFTSAQATALKVVGPINADYAAERVFGGQRERRESGRVSTRWRDDITAIRNGEIDLGIEEDDSFLGFFAGQTYSG